MVLADESWSHALSELQLRARECQIRAAMMYLGYTSEQFETKGTSTQDIGGTTPRYRNPIDPKQETQFVQ